MRTYRTRLARLRRKPVLHRVRLEIAPDTSTCYATFTYNAANNRYSTSGITYDADGDLTYDAVNTYTYNASNKLATAVPVGTTCVNNGWAVCNTYDAFGHAVELESLGVYYQMVYGPAGKMGQMQGSTLQYAYVPLPGRGKGVYSNGFMYVHVDWLGSGRLSTTIPASGNGALVYDRQMSPFGEVYGNSGPSAYWLDFTGDTQDEFGSLYDTDNRELNQLQGRWLTPDPARFGWNLYAYPTNPNSFTDPTGLCPPPGCETRNPGGFPSPSTSCDPGQHNCYSPGDCSATIDGGSAVPCELAFGSALMTFSGNFWRQADTILGSNKIHYQWHPPVGQADDGGTDGYWSVVIDGAPASNVAANNGTNW